MKKIISVLLIVCMLLMSFTINVFAQSTEEVAKITLSDEEATALYAEVNKNIDPYFCFARQIGNVGNYALLFCTLRFDMPYEKVTIIDEYRVTFSSSAYFLYIYDNSAMYYFEDAVKAGIVTMDEIYKEYNPNEYPYYSDAFKIEKLYGIYGDVNSDSEINIIDATEIQKAGVGLIALDEIANILADVNGDEVVSILDVTCIQKLIANIGYDVNLAGKPYYATK